VINLDEAGVSEWEDCESMKVVVPTAMDSQTIHPGVNRNLKQITVRTWIAVSGVSLFCISEEGRYGTIPDPQKVTIWLVPANIPAFPLVFSNLYWYSFSIVIRYARLYDLDLEIFRQL
jgi:hypothetical protein